MLDVNTGFFLFFHKTTSLHIWCDIECKTARHNQDSKFISNCSFFQVTTFEAPGGCTVSSCRAETREHTHTHLLSLNSLKKKGGKKSSPLWGCHIQRSMAGNLPCYHPMEIISCTPTSKRLEVHRKSEKKRRLRCHLLTLQHVLLSLQSHVWQIPVLFFTNPS